MRRVLLTLMVFFTAIQAGPTAAQRIPGPYGPSVTLAQARTIVDAAHNEARNRDFTMAFAVAVPSGDIILLEVMDGTQTGSIDVSQAKAATAARFRRATKVFADTVKSGNPTPMTIDGVLAVEGGVPILSEGKVIGALGVSGGTAEQDGEVAAAALAAVSID